MIELNHVIENDMITYKGLPGPDICDYWSREYSSQFYEEGTSFQIGKIEMVANTGTYIDTPFHRYENGDDLFMSELNKMADLEGIVIRIPFTDTREIDVEHIRNEEIKCSVVLFHTGWDRFWRKDSYSKDHPYLTADAAEYLNDKNVKLVGIDSYNIDDTKGKTRPVHSILLKNGIYIVEHMTKLEALPETGFRFFAVPPRIKGMGSFPVRAFAIID